MSGPIDVTPKAATANSYVTVARANQILRNWLYTTAWDGATLLPSAENYLVNGGATTVGSTTITLDGGTGTMVSGGVIKFAGHATEYTTVTDLTGPGTVDITPGLEVAISDDEAIQRLTPNQKEQALMYATFVLDSVMDWNGFKRLLEDQVLDFPQSNITDDDGNFLDFDTIPLLIEQATAYAANTFLGRDILKKPAVLGLGIRSAQAGPLRFTAETSSALAELPPLDDFILSLLSPLGSLKPGASPGATTAVPVRRT